jgi:hypothetical protein
MPNNALSIPAYNPRMPSRSMIRFAAAIVPDFAFFLSTCALVESVMSGYLRVSAR